MSENGSSSWPGSEIAACQRSNHRLPFKLSLIRYNPTGSGYDGSSRETIERFKAVLLQARIAATVRLTRGRDIEAACGQLASERIAA